VVQGFLLILIIAQLVWLIMFIAKKTSNKIGLLILEFVTYVGSAIAATYYDQLPGSGIMPGFTYMGEVLAAFAAVVATSIIFVITMVVINLRTKKSWLLFFALIFAMIGILTITLQIHLNWGKEKTKATVLEYAKEQVGDNEHEKMRICFVVDGVEYIESIHIYEPEYEIGEEIDIYVRKYAPRKGDEDRYVHTYYENYFGVYMLSFVLSVIFVFAYLKNIKKI